jgi:hypothetical protein
MPQALTPDFAGDVASRAGVDGAGPFEVQGKNAQARDRLFLGWNTGLRLLIRTPPERAAKAKGRGYNKVKRNPETFTNEAGRRKILAVFALGEEFLAAHDSELWQGP